MAAEDRILKILLQLRADTADVSKVNAALAETEALSKNINAGAASGAQVQAGINALTADQVRLTAELAGVKEKSVAETKAEAVAAEAAAAAQARTILQMERRVVVETEIEAAEARIAGNPALAARLEREADIRTRALGIQRALNVTTEESIVLAEKLVLAQEASVAPTALAGVNLGKARQEALVLARELGTGNVRASTLGSLLGSLGPTLTIAGLAGYELFNILSNINELSLQLTKEYDDQLGELSKQIGVWTELAQAAGDFKDIVKLGEQMISPLDAAAKKLDEINAKQLTWKQWLTDLAGLNQFTGADSSAQALATGGANSTEAFQERLQAVKSLLDVANQAKRAWDEINVMPVADGIAAITHNADELHVKQEQLRTDFIDALAKAQQLGNLAAERSTFESPEDQKVSTKAWQDQLEVARKLNAELIQNGVAIDLNDSRLQALTSDAAKLNQKTESLAQAIQKADFANLDPQQRMTALSVDIEKIQQKLREAGVEAQTPKDALKQSANYAKDERQEILLLVEAWLKLLGVVRQTNDEEERARKKAATDAINASLSEQVALIQQIRQQQQLINAHPFLSVDAKQALTLASMTAELAQMAAAIARTKQEIANSILDPALHARLQAQLKKDQFEVDLLKLKIAAINAPLTAQLANWVDSFGTSAHQIANLIEGTINAALQGTNQLLVDAAFGTGDWKKALVGVEKQILSLFLNWLEQMALQKGAQLLGITTTTTAQVASGGAIAAAHAPAAAATSISSYGAAAIIGEVLAVAAIAAIIAALGGAFRKGGYTGDGAADEPAGLVHKGEYVFSKEQTRSIGLDRLAALQEAAGRRGYATGGRVSGDGYVDPVEPGMLAGNLGRAPSGQSYYNYDEIIEPVDSSSTTSSGLPQFYYGRPSVEVTGFGSQGGGTSSGGGGIGSFGRDIAGFGGGFGFANDYNTSLGQMGYGAGYGGYAATVIDPGGSTTTYGNTVSTSSGQFNVGFANQQRAAQGLAPLDLTGVVANTSQVGTASSGWDAHYGSYGPSGYSSSYGSQTFNSPQSTGTSYVGGSIWDMQKRLFAEGGAIPGSPGDPVDITAHVGEFVLRREAADYYGESMLAALNNMQIPARRPGFAAGGQIGGSRSGGGGGSARRRGISIYNYTDRESLKRDFMNDPSIEKFIVNTIDQNRHMIG